MPLTQVTPNTALAVPLQDVKDVCGVPSFDTSMDAQITGLIQEARSHIERSTGRILLTETWKDEYAGFKYPNLFPMSPNINFALLRTPYLLYQEQATIYLPIGPVQSATVQYYDTANVLQTLTQGTDYYLMTPTFLPATLTPNGVWPATAIRPDAVKITLTVGYSTLPGNIARAVKSLAATWFFYRESESEKTTKELNAGLSRIIEQMRIDL